MRKVTALIVVIALVTASPRALAGAHVTREFKSGEAGIRSIAVMPPQGALTVARVGADDPLVAKTKALEARAAELIRKELTRLGYTVTVLTPEDRQRDSVLSELLIAAGHRFDEEYSLITSKAKGVSQRRYSLGESALRLAEHLGVDAFAVTRVDISARAAGERVMQTIKNPLGKDAFVDLTLVHAASGDVEGYFFGDKRFISKEKTENPDELVGKLIEEALQKFPSFDADKFAGQANETLDEQLARIKAMLRLVEENQ